MAITLTPAAAEHVKRIIEKRGDGLGLKLAVRVDGCSGYSYVMDIAQTVASDDHVFTSQGVQIVVPEQSLAVLEGTEVDFVSQGLNQNLVFHNPNAEDACGCGESFSLKSVNNEES